MSGTTSLQLTTRLMRAPGECLQMLFRTVVGCLDRTFPSDFPFKLPDHFRQKFNKRTNSTEVIKTKEYQSTSYSATATEIATTFEWEKYSSYDKLLRILAYMLQLLANNESKRTDTGFITDPTELDNAQQRMFHLVQLESFNTEKKAC